MKIKGFSWKKNWKVEERVIIILFLVITMRIKSRFNINGYEVLCRRCAISDRSFILMLFKKTIFKYISEYHIPNIKMFDERFYWDYKEKRILLRASRRIGMFQLSERNNKLAITWLFLSEQYQGKGIAKYLMTYFEDIAKAKKILCNWIISLE